jgi:glycosyltransferase involved in cell wall biosynthesis
VVFWSSSFDHVRKSQRAEVDSVISIRDGYQIRLLHANSYSSNISLDRWRNHRMLSKKFDQQAPALPRPDVILCSLPTLELSQSAVDFGRKHGVPVVLDVRDLWPDLFSDLVPSILRPLARLALRSMYQQARYACANATGLTGITSEYVDWAVSNANRPLTEWDRPFPMAYVDQIPAAADLDAAQVFWKSQGLSSDEFVVCWFGTVLGRHFEFETVLQAANSLFRDGRNVRFVLCGIGSDLEGVRRLARSHSNVMLPGWMNAAQIWQLLRMSSVGLAPYVSSTNFVRNLPNKPIEYLSAGLPVVSSLQGVLEKFLARHDCGLTYANRNPGDLAHAIASLQDAPRRRLAMSDNAQRVYSEQFVAEKVYMEMKTYLESISRMGAAPSATARAA